MVTTETPRHGEGAGETMENRETHDRGGKGEGMKVWQAGAPGQTAPATSDGFRKRSSGLSVNQSVGPLNTIDS